MAFEELEPGRIWKAEKKLGFGWHNGMYVVRLRTGGLLVQSPTSMGSEVIEELRRLGPVEVLFAPNHYHHLGLPKYREAFPSAKVVASSGALPRLAKQGHAGIEPVESVADLLPEGSHFLVCAGTKTGEAWISVGAENRRSWIVSDAFFHESRPLTGPKGVLIRALKTAPGLCIGQTFRWLAIADNAQYRGWLVERLEDQKPTAILCSHGTPYQVGDGQELRELIRQRLGT